MKPSDIRAAALKAIDDRLAIYEAKKGRADPFAEDSYSRWEAIGYVIEAIGILRGEVERATAADVGNTARPTYLFGSEADPEELMAHIDKAWPTTSRE